MPNLIILKDPTTAAIVIDSKTHGRHEALIDADDVRIVSGHQWRLIAEYRKYGTVFYAATHLRKPEGGWRTKTLHCMIVDAPGLDVDHISGERLDNRRCNLRAISHQENGFNHTRARGCHWSERDRKWYAHIGLNGKRLYLGLFATEEEARAAYLAAKLVHHKIAA